MPSPVAADPVSVAVASTLAARAAAVSGHSSLAAAIAAHRGARLNADAASYLEVDEAAAATLGRGGGTPTGPAGAAPALPHYPI